MPGSFPPIFTIERYDDPKWNRAGRTLYEHGALRFPPGLSTVPLLIDHDDDREVGVVHSLFQGGWIDGPWLHARATVTDPPAWLRKHDTKCSFGFTTYKRRSFTEAETISGALVNEVSILSPSVEISGSYLLPRTRCCDRVLFGSDFPLITPDRWLEDVARADFRDDARSLVLKQNAARLLGLTEWRPGAGRRGFSPRRLRLRRRAPEAARGGRTA